MLKSIAIILTIYAIWTTIGLIMLSPITEEVMNVPEYKDVTLTGSLYELTIWPKVYSDAKNYNPNK